MRDLVTDRGQVQAVGAAGACESAATEHNERARLWIKRRESAVHGPGLLQRQPTERSTLPM
eukprot:6005457-Prorocentrum_lima.AAC.1